MAARLHSLTVLSAGLLIYDVLSTDAGLLAAGCRKVFPVVSEEGAQLPYVCYRRASVQNTPVKGARGSDTATVEIACYAASYAESTDFRRSTRTTRVMLSPPGSYSFPTPRRPGRTGLIYRH